MYEDNRAAKLLAEDPRRRARARHIDIQDMFVAEKVADGTVKIVKVDTQYQLADLLTKSFGPSKFGQLLMMVYSMVTPQFIHKMNQLKSSKSKSTSGAKSVYGHSSAPKAWNGKSD